MHLGYILIRGLAPSTYNSEKSQNAARVRERGTDAVDPVFRLLAAAGAVPDGAPGAPRPGRGGGPRLRDFAESPGEGGAEVGGPWGGRGRAGPPRRDAPGRRAGGGQRGPTGPQDRADAGPRRVLRHGDEHLPHSPAVRAQGGAAPRLAGVPQGARRVTVGGLRAPRRATHSAVGS